MLKDFWNTLGGPARAGLVGGVAVIAAAMIGAVVWIARTDYQVLFADLKPQDTAMMVAELDRLKVPYKIAPDGNTILVDGSVVHTTRLKLMGKDMPLHGAAGFELFNNADFGMTEFAQKINYQRALQGEITRTIMSLSEVRDVRVHLALPEEGLFKRATSKAKAAITLSLKTGQSLRPEQITGIQRLVAASVPGVVAQDVTIIDQQGVALTRVVPAEGEQDAGSGRLDLKRDTERLLARKATEVLERAFGQGQALASVDVTLNMDQVRVTTEDVLGAPGRSGQGMAGVMVKEREVARDVGAPLNGHADTGRASNSQREIEYQVGRRVEQVASQPGAIRRLQVVAVIRQPMDEKQIDQMRVLVAAAVGAVSDRGDTVVVQSLRAFEPQAVDDGAPAVKSSGNAATVPVPQAVPAVDNPTGWAGMAVLAIAFLAGVAWLVWRRTRPARTDLTETQRQDLLEQMQQWLEGTPPSSAPVLAARDPALGARS
ncbi:flagellar basal-body MS-ring/collar protein FliF [Ramlibacter sp. WS9]|uniref:flagellar basal-body MS-ring/collar protein FliF n=1 Tax=Ramlibacter sp. WS9 TaxID=1882741 RepID=UPI001142A22F|nr:flagellar basal-body MS-ring/collar protein FliF [Ramlibacter sp. WS9]ROZ63190.1 flagellar M-ring protein FliF [Ramlibacter sp. WS9]